tara:strand:+ start:1644 stop:1814 length:171 start_codon:yes stop_codon:yes gene_type:complete
MLCSRKSFNPLKLKSDQNKACLQGSRFTVKQNLQKNNIGYEEKLWGETSVKYIINN